jgi:alpha-glucosidase (family GH31 glycosyl hydrolase)
MRPLLPLLAVATLAAAAPRPRAARPGCVDATDAYGGYVVNGAVARPTRTSATARLTLAVPAQPELGRDVTDTTVAVQATCDDVVRVRLGPPSASDLPAALVPTASLDGRPCAAGGDETHRLNFTIADDPFSVSVFRGADAGRPLFSTAGFRLLVKASFLEITTTLDPSSTLYGLGERTDELAVARSPSPTPRALFARDTAASVRATNLYGAWPLAIVVGNDGATHGLLIASAAPMDVLPRVDALTFRLLAPSITLFVLAGPTPAAVLDAATRITGRPALPPAWALGAGQSKWGWASPAQVEAAVAGYDAAAIPLDVVWADIDYMSDHRDWTLDEARYPLNRTRALVASLHAAGRRWVPIVDPGVPAVPGYGPYDAGLAAGAFVRAPLPAPLSEPYVGAVWPGLTVWPDFTAASASARDYWADAVAAFHHVVPFDGLWIDMNEPSNFKSTPDASPHPPPFSPYCINNGGDRAPLAASTLPPLARSGDYGTPHAARHNLYGLAEAVATHAGLTRAAPSRRPFILSRSTFPGAGAAAAAHWTGDNNSTWADLAASVPGALAAGLAGLPLAGADVCGFAGNASEALCGAWTGAAAFLPFLRNHAAIDAADQEPWRWPAVAAVARRTYGLRYALMPSLYSGLATAAATGLPLARPLWLHWSGEAAARAATGTWLLGGDLFVAPALTPAAVAAGTVTTWLPPGTWCDVWALTTQGGRRTACHAGPAAVTLPSSPASPALLQRAGSVLPLSAEALAVLTSTAATTAPVRALAAATGPVTLCAVLDGDGSALGSLYVDDGESVSAGGWASLAVSGGRLVVRGEGGTALPRSVVVASAVVHGVATRPTTVAAAGGRVEWTWSEGTLLVDLGGAVVREGGEEVAVVWR